MGSLQRGNCTNRQKKIDQKYEETTALGAFDLFFALVRHCPFRR